jgi:diguanylate cyclase (GGDEF)-like protein
MEDHKTTRIPTLRRRLSNDGAALVVIFGLDRLGKRFPLERDMTVGRDPDVEISLENNDLSRRHALFAQRRGAWTVTDLGSTNGTLVNDRLATGEVVLTDGDLIKVGGVILKYLAGGNVESHFHEEIYRMTVHDGLTGVHNRRAFLELMEREIARSARYGSRLSLALIDLDHFKQVNDTHGHQAGDLTLQRVARAAARLVTPEQMLARYGGEEFALVLPELSAEEARAVCEHVRFAIANEIIDWNDQRIAVTVSIGLATSNESMSVSDLISAADAELYRAKQAGRNRVMVVGDRSQED